MSNTITITNLSNNDTKDMPFTLAVSYTADMDGLEIAVVYSGFSVSPQDAPQSSGSPTFQLNWAGTVSGTTVTVRLREKANPSNILDFNTKTGLTFLGGPP